MNITTNSRANRSEAYNVATSWVVINRLHTLPVTEQDKEKFETVKKVTQHKVISTHKKLGKLQWDILKKGKPQMTR